MSNQEETETEIETLATYTIEAWHEGLKLARLEGFRMIVVCLGGAIESVDLLPPEEVTWDREDDNRWWRMRVHLVLPLGREARCQQIADHQFDGKVEMTRTGSRTRKMRG